MQNIIYRALFALFAMPLFYLPVVSHAADAGGTSDRDLTGTWIGYYQDGSKSPYVWAIRQKASSISIQNVGGKTATSPGSIEGNKVVALDFATQHGTLSADGSKISWTDGVVWRRAPKPGDISGTWVGYFDDGSKSEYVWSIKQIGSTLAIQNVGGQTARSKGRIDGDKVVAQDFATQNGKLSSDGSRITWTDGVVWKRQ